MAKTKVVLKLDMFDNKSRSKALKTVVSATGVTSVALDSGDKTKLVVIGEGMDAFELVKSLRKNFRTELISLEEVKEEEKKKDDETKPAESWPFVYHPCVPQYILQPFPVYSNHDPYSIL